jgi:hypothetical protein
MIYTTYLLFLVFMPNLAFTSYARCSVPQELTSKDAIDLVRKHGMFDIHWTIRIYTAEIHMSHEELEHSQPYYSALKSLELIKLTNPIQETPEGKKTRTDRTIVSLTEKGRLQSKDWKQPKENEWVIPVAVREFAEMVRFQKISEDSAGIEFFWTHVANAIGEAMKLEFRREKAIAYFKFSDGKWQITKIRASS